MDAGCSITQPVLKVNAELVRREETVSEVPLPRILARIRRLLEEAALLFSMAHVLAALSRDCHQKKQ
jgi:hypothetical protein